MNKIKLILLAITICLNNGVSSLEIMNANTPSCASHLIQKLFSSYATIYFAFDHLKYDFIPLHIVNPRIIAKINEPIRLSWNLQNNFLIFTKGHESLNDTLKILKESSVWQASKTSRGKFLIFTSSNCNLKATFEVLWSYDIIKAVIIVYSEELAPKLFMSDPFEKNNHCGKQANVFWNQTCEADVRFNETIKNFNGCSINVPFEITRTTFQEARGPAVMYQMILIIGETLNANKAYGYPLHNEKIDLYNRSVAILLSYGVTRGNELLADYDLTEILVTSSFVWGVPKPNKIYGYRIIANIYKNNVWMAIGMSLILMTVTWWLMTKWANDLIGFQEFWRSVLAILAFLLCGSDSLNPKTTTIKFLALFFSLYCLQIRNSLNANLISALTTPVYEQGITTIEELADSGLPLLIYGRLTKINYEAAYGADIYKKMQKQFIDAPKVNLTGDLRRIVMHRNFSMLHSKQAIEVSGLQSEVGALDAKLFKLEGTCYLRKGHYFLPTFNKFIRMMHEHGFYEWSMRQGPRPQFYTEDIVPVSKLELSHLIAPFILLGVGLSFATIAFLTELYSLYLIQKTLFGFNIPN